jgi:phosphoribosylamine--glycine ligase
VVTAALHRQVMERIMIPTVRAMAQEGSPLRGVLYAGLMISGGVAKVLEFNVRLGDPEAQPLLVRIQGDLVPTIEAALRGDLHSCPLAWDAGAAVCVVMASQGYPGAYEKGRRISGLDEAGAQEGVVVFHAGTGERDGQLVTDGGRVLGVTARGGDVREAIRRAYAAVERISWEGVHFRRDIGRRALEREEG